ncbi:MAG: glycosyltransferase family 39 protein [Chitinophagaceae bacterium]|nr:glycosyltransferase family 39 protein [Chitinophagaceae bacterium]
MRVLKPASFVLILLILAKFVIQYLVVHPAYDLQRDEYLHLDQANHLAWGYASVPPVTSWISWMILRLGNGEFWVRFFPALFGALTIVVVWETTRRLGGKLFALTAAAVAILFSSLLRLNMLFQPNSLEILCWTTFFYLIIVYIQTEKPKWLYIAAIVFAIGFLNKYNIVFMVAGLIPAILIVPQRKLFLNKHLMGAAVLALLLISPNLIWQWQNNFPVFRHLEELATTQLLHVRRSDFLIDQVFFFYWVYPGIDRSVG